MSKTVQLFVTCIIDTLYPETGEAVVRVLEKAGAQVSFPPGQTCCGQPAFNAGLRKQARQMAIQTIKAFEKFPGSVLQCFVILMANYLLMILFGFPKLSNWQNDLMSLPNSW
jgi:Fe-S oxidoreductase